MPSFQQHVLCSAGPWIRLVQPYRNLFTEESQMPRFSPILMALFTIACVPLAQAQGASEFNKEAIKSTGEAAAMAFVCGKLNQAQIDAHKEKARRLYLADGISQATFDTLYAEGFKEVQAKAKANHVQAGSPQCQLPAPGEGKQD